MEYSTIISCRTSLLDCNVYEPVFHNFKADFWHSLNSFQNFQNAIIARDFNATISSKERRGGSLVKDPFGEHFEALIANLDVVDIKPKKGMYT